MAEKTDKSKSVFQTKHIPKDAQVIMSIMKDMGIEEYDPRVVNQLLEFVYRYVTCILDDARIYSRHDKKDTKIDVDDVKLAIDIMLERIFVTPPSRQTLFELAKSTNHTPLPLIKPHAGLRLPADRYCLSACNYRMKQLQKKTSSLQKSQSYSSGGGGMKGSSKALNVTVIKQKGISHQVALNQLNAHGAGNLGNTTVSVPKPIVKFTTTPTPTIRTQIVASNDTNSNSNTKIETMEID